MALSSLKPPEIGLARAVYVWWSAILLREMGGKMGSSVLWLVYEY